MAELDGKVAIITGAGRGIGASIARFMSAEGAALVINDLGGSTDGTGADEGPIRAVADELAAAGAGVVTDSGDIADAGTGERLVEAAVETFGGLDIVVNVAGILRDRMIFNMSEEDWDAVIRVHLRGHFSTARPAAAYWRAKRNPEGQYRIINFTSESGLDGSPGQANYAAAKMGIVGLTYSLAQGLARYGVTANAIAPAAATRLVVDAAQLSGTADELLTDPLQSPDNVSRLVLYLASARSHWLTGRVLGASGHAYSLYNNPEVVRQIDAPSPWPAEDLAVALERNFRPVADGLPRSFFASQLDRS